MACCLLGVYLMERLVRFLAWPIRALTGRAALVHADNPPLGTWSTAHVVPARIFFRSNQRWPAWLALGALIEVALGAALSAGLLVTASPPGIGQNHHAQHEMDHGHATEHVATIVDPSGMLIIILGIIVLILAGIAMARQWSTRRRLGLTVVGMALGVWPVMHSGHDFPHLAAMVQLELLVLAVPSLLVPIVWNKRRWWRESTASKRGRAGWGNNGALMAILAVPAMLTFWHLPAFHAVAGPVSSLARPLSLFAVGMALWIVASRRATMTGFLNGGQALLISYALSAPLGIAMIISSISDGLSGALGTGLPTDRLLAGLVMMLCEIVIVVPALRHFIAGVPGSWAKDSKTQTAGVRV